MTSVIPINFQDFKNKFSTPDIKQEIIKLFTPEDIRWIHTVENAHVMEKFLSLPKYLKFSITNPQFLLSFVIPNILKFTILNIQRENTEEIEELPIVKNAVMKASIAATFEPKRMLEIGTYLGVGAAVFKKAVPSCRVITMNPRNTYGANNPLKEGDIGLFYRKKNLDIDQIWSDSTIFDYSRISPVDVSYIDGNHIYEYIYKDLENMSLITKKCVFLDDYIPEKIYDNRHSLIYGPWSQQVVKATDDFLRINPNQYSKCYWISDSKYCVLIK